MGPIVIFSSFLSPKDENGWEKSRPVPPVFYIYPVRFRIYGKIQKWDGKQERLYPVYICGIPFLAGIILYFSHIYKIWEKNK